MMFTGNELIGWNDMDKIKYSHKALYKICHARIVFSTGTYINQLIVEPVENKLYFTTGKRVETCQLESGVRTTVVNSSSGTRGLAVDRNSR